MLVFTMKVIVNCIDDDDYEWYRLFAVQLMIFLCYNPKGGDREVQGSPSRTGKHEGCTRHEKRGEQTTKERKDGSANGGMT